MSSFRTPLNVEDALRRKREVADEVTRLQARLKDAAPLDEAGSPILDRRVRNEFRQRVKYRLETLYAETRFLKDWLRLHATHKPSEYEMLGRAYRALSLLEERGVEIGVDAEALLSDIELHVPHAYLFQTRGAA